jgi:MscS family membrane protein
MAMILQFLDTEYLGNTLRQYAWLLAIFLFVIIFNKYISSLISKLLFQLLRKTRFRHQGKLFLKLMLQPLEFYLILHTLFIGFHTLHTPAYFENEFMNVSVQEYMEGLYHLLFILCTGWLLSRFTDFIITVMNEKALLTPDPSDDQVVAFLKDVFKVFVWSTVLLAILAFVFHVNITSLVAGAGIAGLAIAFAAQETLQNIFGAISIFTEKPFVVGELVEVAGIIGTVDKVGFRSTRITSLDRAYLTIPNKNIVAGNINNLSRRTSRKVQFLLGLEYGTPPAVIETIVQEIRKYTTGHPRMNEPSVVNFYQFGPSSLDIWVEYYLEYIGWDKFMPLRQEIMMRIMDIVLENGGSFAFPSQTLYLKNEATESKSISSNQQEEEGV